MADFKFRFLNGSSIEATTGEDGITVHILQDGEEPLIGTFTDFDNLLNGIAPIYSKNANSGYELATLSYKLKTAFETDMTKEDIANFLVKAQWG